NDYAHAFDLTITITITITTNYEIGYRARKTSISSLSASSATTITNRRRTHPTPATSASPAPSQPPTSMATLSVTPARHSTLPRAANTTVAAADPAKFTSLVKATDSISKQPNKLTHIRVSTVA